MTTQDDQQLIKDIAAGGPFDPVQAIRLLARNLAANPAKQAPAAVMDTEVLAEATPKRKKIEPNT